METIAKKTQRPGDIINSIYSEGIISHDSKFNNQSDFPLQHSSSTSFSECSFYDSSESREPCLLTNNDFKDSSIQLDKNKLLSRHCIKTFDPTYNILNSMNDPFTALSTRHSKAVNDNRTKQRTSNKCTSKESNLFVSRKINSMNNRKSEVNINKGKLRLTKDIKYKINKRISTDESGDSNSRDHWSVPKVTSPISKASIQNHLKKSVTINQQNIIYSNRQSFINESVSPRQNQSSQQFPITPLAQCLLRASVFSQRSHTPEARSTISSETSESSKKISEVDSRSTFSPNSFKSPVSLKRFYSTSKDVSQSGLTTEYTRLSERYSLRKSSVAQRPLPIVFLRSSKGCISSTDKSPDKKNSLYVHKSVTEQPTVVSLNCRRTLVDIGVSEDSSFCHSIHDPNIQSSQSDTSCESDHEQNNKPEPKPFEACETFKNSRYLGNKTSDQNEYYYNNVNHITARRLSITLMKTILKRENKGEIEILVAPSFPNSTGATATSNSMIDSSAKSDMPNMFQPCNLQNSYLAEKLFEPSLHSTPFSFAHSPRTAVCAQMSTDTKSTMRPDDTDSNCKTSCAYCRFQTTEEYIKARLENPSFTPDSAHRLSPKKDKLLPQNLDLTFELLDEIFGAGEPAAVEDSSARGPSLGSIHIRKMQSKDIHCRSNKSKLYNAQNRQTDTVLSPALLEKKTSNISSQNKTNNSPPISRTIKSLYNSDHEKFLEVYPMSPKQPLLEESSTGMFLDTLDDVSMELDIVDVSLNPIIPTRKNRIAPQTPSSRDKYKEFSVSNNRYLSHQNDHSVDLINSDRSRSSEYYKFLANIDGVGTQTSHSKLYPPRDFSAFSNKYSNNNSLSPASSQNMWPDDLVQSHWGLYNFDDFLTEKNSDNMSVLGKNSNKSTAFLQSDRRNQGYNMSSKFSNCNSSTPPLWNKKHTYDKSRENFWNDDLTSSHAVNDFVVKLSETAEEIKNSSSNIYRPKQVDFLLAPQREPVFDNTPSRKYFNENNFYYPPQQPVIDFGMQNSYDRYNNDYNGEYSTIYMALQWYFYNFVNYNAYQEFINYVNKFGLASFLAQIPPAELNLIMAQYPKYDQEEFESPVSPDLMRQKTSTPITPELSKESKQTTKIVKDRVRPSEMTKMLQNMPELDSSKLRCVAINKPGALESLLSGWEAFWPTLAKESSSQSSPITAFMLRNLPHRWDSCMIWKLLCYLDMSEDVDYFYMPWSFVFTKNIGYAFINFCSNEKGLLFQQKITDLETSKYGVSKNLIVNEAKYKNLGFHLKNLLKQRDRMHDGSRLYIYPYSNNPSIYVTV